MTPIRLGAVGYLNARPLVRGLDAQADRFALRFDVPSRCASLLHEGRIDLGVIPSIEYLQRSDYRIVPGVAIASRGTAASVALFSTRPVNAIRSIAIDSSSRTSVMLLRILCAQSFDIEPKLVTLPPDLEAMVKRCDAALLIGDPALFADHDGLGLDKIDLGEEWLALTGLPFVYAVWAGRAGAIDAGGVAAMQAARDAGVAASDDVARQYYPDDDEKAAVGARYLRENMKYQLGEDELAGLRRFYGAAADLRFVPSAGKLQFFP
jgi:chorismate dehydratase